METCQVSTLKEIIETSLNKSMSYEEYVQLFENLVEENTTSGNELSQERIDYTKLNERRLKRWNKTLKISEETQNTIKQHNKKTTWLVLTESWCGDAAHTLPVMNKISELNDNIDFRLVLRDENEALMNEFLTNGGKAIPKLIALDEENKVIGEFGSRPSIATQLVEDFKKEHGKLTAEFKQELQVWYNKDKGENTLEDLLRLL